MNVDFGWSVLFGQFLHLLAAGVAGAALIHAIRSIRLQSKAVGHIVAAGILFRAILGLSLFWTSYLRLPVLRSLQLGGGFWSVTPDASSYYQYAINAIDHGLGSVNPSSSSPMFVKILAIWMRAVGISPAAALLLNLCLFAGLLAVVVRLYAPVNNWRRDLPLVLGAASFSFSPVMLINSTQVLKDDLFSVLIASACVSVLFILQRLVNSAYVTLGRVDLVGWLIVLLVTVYCLAGIRDYFAVIIWAALGLALALFVRGSISVASRYVAAAICILSLLWFDYALGAGPYYRGPTIAHVIHKGQGVIASVTGTVLGQPIDDPTASSQPPLGVEIGTLAEAAFVVDYARRGFVLTGGDTNIVPKSDLPSRGKALALGLATTFVPISALRAASVVQFSGGRALLPFTDLDTVFMDLSVACAIVVLLRRRHLVGNRLPFVVFAVTLSSITAVLLAYVVTNFGTLFRMRLMVAVPLWLLMLALSESRADDAACLDVH